jgi:hypothetical protein
MESKIKPPVQVKLDPNYSNAVYKILVNKFHQKYDGKLTENQKKFLIQYTASSLSEDQNSFIQVVKQEHNRILNTLTKITDPKIKEDKELSKKLVECTEKYKSLMSSGSLMEEKTILEFLQYIKLVDEVAS